MDSIGRTWKGSKRTLSSDKSQTRAGVDLKDRFRIEIPEVYLPVLRASYPNSSGSKDGFESQYLNIFLPFDSVDDVFERWNDAYSAQGWKHRCDGEKIVRQITRQTAYRGGKSYQKRVSVSCELPCQRAENETICSECSHVGYLTFQISELVAQAGMSKVLTQTLTGITDVIGVYNQLLVFHQKYGSLRRSPVPSPGTYELIPFVMRRVKQQISRPVYDKGSKQYTDAYTQMEAYPILITEHPEWLEHWTMVSRRMRILQMVQNGQAALLMPADVAIYQEMMAIALPGTTEDPIKALTAYQEASPLPDLEPIDTVNLSPDYGTEFDESDEWNGDEDWEENNNLEPLIYAEKLQSRPVAERIAAVDAVLPSTLSRDEKTQLWGTATDSRLSDGDRCTQLIDEILIWFAMTRAVNRQTMQEFLANTRLKFPAMVDEDLATYATTEIPHLGSPAPKSAPTTINGHSID